ncbi:MAG: ABC transporter permease [Sandaracinaceae bacterium]|nr:ABC transporter permease [Sandaracinaceae bacterium]
MIEMILKRAGTGVLIVLFATTSIFFLAHGIGDPAVATLGPNASPARLQGFREQHGLDQPLLTRYGSYVGAAATGDLGRSFRDGQPVASVIATRLPRTLLLMSMAMSLQLLIGLTLGILAALRRNTWFDTGFMGVAFLGISVPTFVSGPIFLMVFAFLLGWFPIGGYGVSPLDHVGHALLPALTMAIVGASMDARIMRSEMIDTLGADYVRTAKAKGLSPARVVLAHAARNALLPIVTLIGLQLPNLVAGAIITETIFAWPGMGRLVIESITSLDIPVILGVVVVTAVAVQLGNGFADVAVALLDPRVRRGR